MSDNKKIKYVTIWRRFLKSIVPAVMLLVILMDIFIYITITKNAKIQMQKSCLRTVTITAETVASTFRDYHCDLLHMRKKYRVGHEEEFMKYIKEYADENMHEYSYLRLTMLNGISYTTTQGRDKKDSRYRKPYRQIVLEHKTISINNSHSTDLHNYEVLSVSIPVYDTNTNKVNGVLSAIFPTEVLDKRITKTKMGGTGFMSMLDDEMNLRIYADSVYTTTVTECINKGYKGIDTLVFNAREKSKYGINYGISSYFKPNKTEILAQYANIPGTSWYLILNIQQNGVNWGAIFTIVVLFVTAVLTIIIVTAIIKHLTKSIILEPLKKITKFTNDFTHGKLYTTETEQTEIDDELSNLKKEIASMQHRLYTVVGDIRNKSKEISVCSNSITQTVQTIDQDAQVQSIAVEDISMSIEIMQKSIQHNTDNAATSKTISDEISNDIKKITQASVSTLECINNVIQKVKVINEITSRTDLLAINASVEASRAAEHGKGFAVVAAEIRKLAEHCHRASNEINQISAESLATTNESAELINKISPKIRDNAELVSQISQACDEQLQMTLAISNSIEQLTEITSNNAISADEMAVNTNVLSVNIDKLSNSVSFFKLDQKSDFRRSELIHEIDTQTFEMLKLKNELIAIAGNSPEIKKANIAIDEAQKISDMARSFDTIPSSDQQSTSQYTPHKNTGNEDDTTNYESF